MPRAAIVRKDVGYSGWQPILGGHAHAPVPQWEESERSAPQEALEGDRRRTAPLHPNCGYHRALRIVEAPCPKAQQLPDARVRAVRGDDESRVQIGAISQGERVPI